MPTVAVTSDPSPNVAPRLCGSLSFTLSEADPAGATSIIMASNRYGDVLTFGIADGANSDKFEIVKISNSVLDGIPVQRAQIRTTVALNFKDHATIPLRVTLHDGKGVSNNMMVVDDTGVDVSEAVAVSILDVEELGVITFSPEDPEAGVAQAASLTDGDGSTSSLSWRWSRSSSRNGPWTEIMDANSAICTSTQVDEGFFPRATVTYTDQRGPNKTAVEIAGDLASRNQWLTYSLTGGDADSFTISSSNGQIRVASGVTLDYEGKRTYRLTVQVTDGRDQNGDDEMDAIDDTQSVTVTLIDVNEATVVTGDTPISFEENSSSVVASYTGTYPERDSLTWSVNNNNFHVSERGQLFFQSPPNFEAGVTSYTVTVTATDDEDPPISGSLVVTVTITDAEEEGSVAVIPPRGWADPQTQFTANLIDDDGEVTGHDWLWERSLNGRSGWQPIPGETSNTYDAGADDTNKFL